MPVYHIFVINRAGSLIYDYDASPRGPELEKTFGYPLDFRFTLIDQKITVSFGERDGIRVGYVLLAFNGEPVHTGGKLRRAEGEADVLELLQLPASYPLSLKFGRPGVSTNEKIILSSMFHSLYAIGAQLSPAARSSGIQTLDTDTFRLHCFQTITGNKFVVVADPQSGNLELLLKKIYELYADYALKNPFYSLEMPIRCDLFDSALQSLLEKFDRTGSIPL